MTRTCYLREPPGDVPPVDSLTINDKISQYKKIRHTGQGETQDVTALGIRRCAHGEMIGGRRVPEVRDAGSTMET